MAEIETLKRSVLNTCEGRGCSTFIEWGLDLRFCPECRPKQPIPTRSRRSQGRYTLGGK